MKNPYEHSSPDQFKVGAGKPLQQAGSPNNMHERDGTPNPGKLTNPKDVGKRAGSDSIKGI